VPPVLSETDSAVYRVHQQNRKSTAPTGSATVFLASLAALREACWIDAGHFPPAFDFFRVEWERAAWSHAGQPRAELRAKLELIRWRLHGLLAELTGDLDHYYEAVAARPDLPTTQAALGCALGREGRSADAVPHLRRAVESSPFDLSAARALYQALGEAGDADGQRELARDRALLAKAAPRIVPPELWFQHEEVRSLSSAVRSQEDNPPGGSSLRTTDHGLRSAVVWEGEHDAVQSLALVNRAICGRLRLRGHAVACIPSGHSQTEAEASQEQQRLADFFQQVGRRPADVHVRHQWPPRFIRPPAAAG